MKVLKILSIMDKNHNMGVLAILDSIGRTGGRAAVKYFGKRYGVAFPFCKDISGYDVKTVTSAKEFDPYFYAAYPNWDGKPTQGISIVPWADNPTGGIVIGNNHILFANGQSFKWKPHFEKSVDLSKFKPSTLLGQQTIEYQYKQPIAMTFRGAEQEKPFPATLGEYVMINKFTCDIQIAVVYAEGDQMVMTRLASENGGFGFRETSKLPIGSWKRVKQTAQHPPLGVG